MDAARAALLYPGIGAAPAVDFGERALRSPVVSPTAHRPRASPHFGRAGPPKHPGAAAGSVSPRRDDAILQSPRTREGEASQAIADRLREAIVERVFVDDRVGPFIMSTHAMVLPEVPKVPESDFPTATGEFESAEKTAAYVQKLQNAARRSDADENERELLLGLCDFMSCVSEKLAKHPRTELSTQLDHGICHSASQEVVPTIREFVKLEDMRDKAPAFSEMETRLAAVQKAEEACSQVTDVRGRKQALQAVWHESFKALTFARESYEQLAPLASLRAEQSGDCAWLTATQEKLREAAEAQRKIIADTQRRCSEGQSCVESCLARGSHEVATLHEQVTRVSGARQKAESEFATAVDKIVAKIAPELAALHSLHARARTCALEHDFLRKQATEAEAEWAARARQLHVLQVRVLGLAFRVWGSGRRALGSCTCCS